MFLTFDQMLLIHNHHQRKPDDAIVDLLEKPIVDSELDPLLWRGERHGFITYPGNGTPTEMVLSQNKGHT